MPEDKNALPKQLLNESGMVSFRRTVHTWNYLSDDGSSDKLSSVTTLLPEPDDPDALCETDLEWRRKHAYRAAATEIVRTARWKLKQQVTKLSRTDLVLPSAEIDGKILDELVEGYFTGRMGDREQVRLAFRRLAEEMLRRSLPRYSARREPDAVAYFKSVYKDLFQVLDLNRGSLNAVDGTLFATLQRRGLFSQI